MNIGVKCWRCNKLIKVGQSCIGDETTIGIWCSAECWALDKGRFKKTKLTDDDLISMKETNAIYQKEFYEFDSV